ncbi:aminotransferase class V-fold PLP-dependent enzyme [bacterium]|nr:aminotransferase class V-fold PLP-dependent enzyme [bacterium]
MNTPAPLSRRAFFTQSFLGIAAAGLKKPSLLPANRTSGHIETFQQFREQLLLDPAIAYLNTGSLGTCPAQVLDLIHAKARELEEDPVGMNWGRLGEEAEQVRGKAAAFFGVDADEIIITRNTTEGMNSAGSGIDLQPGDEVLTTDEEHPGGLVCWEHSRKHRGIALKTVRLPRPAVGEEGILEAVHTAVTGKTRIFSFSQVTTATGLRLPVRKIAAMMRQRGIITICDGAQAPGMIAIDLRDLGVDVWCTSGHKWLCGPKGTGILYIRKEAQERFHPVFLHSGNQVYSASSGTRDVSGIIGLGRSLDIITGLGIGNIEQRCLELRAYLIEKLDGIPHIRLLSSRDPALESALVTVDLERAGKQEVYEALKQRGVIVKLLPVYNALRFSTHFFNTREEIDRLCGALVELV